MVYLFGAHLPRLSWTKDHPLNGCLLCRFCEHVAVVVCVCAAKSSDIRGVSGSPDADGVVLLQPHVSGLYQQHHYGNAVSDIVSLGPPIFYSQFYCLFCGIPRCIKFVCLVYLNTDFSSAHSDFSEIATADW